MAVVAVTSAAACGDGDGPSGPDEGIPEVELTFLRHAANAPPLLTSGDTTVVATRGVSLDLEIFYEAEGGGGERGDRFLRFTLEDGSLLRHPDGTPFADGEQIAISLHLDPELLAIEFEPSGLVFDPDAPARLELRYAEADGDYDEDGDEDSDDAELEDEIDLWRQESPGDPWFRIGEIRDLDLDEVKARLFGFSRYALAI